MVAAPAVPAVLAQQPAPASLPGAAARTSGEAAPLEMTAADAAVQSVPRFFSETQYAALRKLSELIMPPMSGMPGALDAGAPEFLDFLIGTSPADRQHVYRSGLDLLNSNAQERFNKGFAELDASQAAVLLAPMREAWTYDPPADPLANFLRTAKHDVRTATMHSREWSSSDSGGGRRPRGVGLYWYPLD